MRILVLVTCFALMSAPALAAKKTYTPGISVLPLEGYLTGTYSSNEQARSVAKNLLLGITATNANGEAYPNYQIVSAEVENFLKTIDRDIGPQIQQDRDKQRNLEILISELDFTITKYARANQDDIHENYFIAALLPVLVSSMYFGLRYYGHGLGNLSPNENLHHILVTMNILIDPLSVFFLTKVLIWKEPSKRKSPPEFPESTKDLLTRLQRAKLQWCGLVMGLR